MPELHARYGELQQVDAALRGAEEKLKNAHLSRGCGERPETLYREVVALRERARQLLDALADLLIHGGIPETADHEDGQPDSIGKRSP